LTIVGALRFPKERLFCVTPKKDVGRMMMTIAFINLKRGLVPLIEGVCAQIYYFVKRFCADVGLPIDKLDEACTNVDDWMMLAQHRSGDCVMI